MTSGGNGERALSADFASDVGGSLLRNGGNVGIWTMDKLNNMFQNVVHHFEEPVVGLTTPRLTIGTWLSHSVQQLEYKKYLDAFVSSLGEAQDLVRDVCKCGIMLYFVSDYVN